MSTALDSIEEELEAAGERIEEIAFEIRTHRSEESRLQSRAFRSEHAGGVDEETAIALEEVRAALRDLDEDLAIKRADMDALLDQYRTGKVAA